MSRSRQHSPAKELLQCVVEALELEDVHIAAIDTGQIAQVEADADQSEEYFEIGSAFKPLVAAITLRTLSDNGLDATTALSDVFRDADGTIESYLGSRTFKDVLSHRSGLNSDAFVDTGNDGQELARYTEYVVRTVPLLSPTSRLFSYSTIGYNLLGRCIELLDGRRFRNLVEDLSLRVEDQSPLPASSLPSGARVSANPSQYLRLMAKILDEAPQVHPELLTPEVQLPRPNATGAIAWACGLAIYGSRPLVVGHDGSTPSRSTVFRYNCISRRGIIASFGPGAPRQRVQQILGRILGAESDNALENLPQTTNDLASLSGTYENWQYRRTLRWDGRLGHFVCESTPLRELADLAGNPAPFVGVVARVRSDLLVTDNTAGETTLPLNIVKIDNERIALHDGRLMPRVSP